MIDPDRLYWQERAREEFERAIGTISAKAREAHGELALLHLGQCRRTVRSCEDRAQCCFGGTCAVASRIAGLETLDIR